MVVNIFHILLVLVISICSFSLPGVIGSGMGSLLQNPYSPRRIKREYEMAGGRTVKVYFDAIPPGIYYPSILITSN